MMRLLMNYEEDPAGTKRWVYLASRFTISARKYNPGDFYLRSDFPVSPLPYQFAKRNSDEIADAVPNSVTIKLSDGTEYEIPSRQIRMPTAMRVPITSPGIRVDSTLKRLFESCLFYPGDDGAFMRYSPHLLLVTNTKTGKTALAQTVGVCVSKVTANALIGYGTADRQRTGSLAAQNGGLIALDEVLEKIGDELFGDLLNAMELGRVRVISGASDSEFECSSPLAFMANPRTGEAENEQTLYSLFDSMMRKISVNSAAFGSRFGAVCFGLDYKTVSGGEAETRDELAIRNFRTSGQKVVNGEKLRDAFDDKKILTWLNQPYDDKYLEQLDELASRASERLLRSFIEGHRESYRHARGLALRLSLLGEDEDKDEEFAFVQGVNLASFSRILEGANRYGGELSLRHKQNAVTGYLAYFFLRLAEASMRLGSVASVPWAEIKTVGMNAYFGMSREDFERKVVARLQGHFSDDFDANLSRIEIIKPGALNLANLPKFAGAAWLKRDE